MIYDYTDYYPCIIFMTRYGGVYEGGQWACIPFSEEIPPYAIDDDITCCEWWNSPQSELVGRGSSPNDAYNDMMIRHDLAKMAVYDKKGQEHIKCSVVDCDLGTFMGKYAICSGRCLPERPRNNTYYFK
jgi:hypothetical protein